MRTRLDRLSQRLLTHLLKKLGKFPESRLGWAPLLTVLKLYLFKSGTSLSPLAKPSPLTEIMTANDDILSPELLQKAGNLEIIDENGTKLKFSSLYAEKQTLVIFIRHFMCGNCMVHSYPAAKLTLAICLRFEFRNRSFRVESEEYQSCDHWVWGLVGNQGIRERHREQVPNLRGSKSIIIQTPQSTSLVRPRPNAVVHDRWHLGRYKKGTWRWS